MDESIKKKRKLNGFDIALIIVLILVLGVVFFLFILPKITNSGSAISFSGNDTVKVRYTIMMKDIPNEIQFDVEPGDCVVEIVKATEIGSVVSSKITPAQHFGENTLDGSVKIEDSICKKTLHLVVEADAVKSDNGYSINGQNLFVESPLTIRTPGICGYSVCTSIEEVDGNE